MVRANGSDGRINIKAGSATGNAAIDTVSQKLFDLTDLSDSLTGNRKAIAQTWYANSTTGV